MLEIGVKDKTMQSSPWKEDKNTHERAKARAHNTERTYAYMFIYRHIA